MDKNKDGVVTLEEFIMACQEVCTVWGENEVLNNKWHKMAIF